MAPANCVLGLGMVGLVEHLEGVISLREHMISVLLA